MNPRPSTKSTKVYLIGSLRNPEVPKLARELRALGVTVFDDWYASGPEADDIWREYEQARGRSFVEALNGQAAQNQFSFDKRNLDDADVALVVAPAGRSGHLELGYALGQGKRGYIYIGDEPDRWDIMYAFATAVFDDKEKLLEEVRSW